MKEGKFNLLDLQREELSDEEIKKIYSKDNVEKSEGCDNDETKEEKTLQKLEEESFDISSKLEKNPNDKKLIEKYAEIEVKIKKIKESEAEQGDLTTEGPEPEGILVDELIGEKPKTEATPEIVKLTEEEKKNLIASLKDIAKVYKTLEDKRSEKIRTRKSELDISNTVNEFIKSAMENRNADEIRDIIDNSGLKDDEKDYVKRAIEEYEVKSEVSGETVVKETSPIFLESLALKDLLESPNISLEEVRAIISGLDKAKEILEGEKSNEEITDKLEKIETKLTEAKKIEKMKEAEENDAKLALENIRALVGGTDLEGLAKVFKSGKHKKEKDKEKEKKPEIEQELSKISEKILVKSALPPLPETSETELAGNEILEEESRREEMEEKLAKANRILFLYAKRDKLIDVNLVSQTNKEIRNLYGELGDIEKLRGVLVVEGEYEKIKQVGAEIKVEKMGRVEDTEEIETIEPEPEKEKVPRSLKESREKIERTIDVLYARLAEESKKLEEELSEEERTKVMKKIEEFQGILAILGLSLQSIRATEASSLKPKEEKEILENVVEAHKLELKNYERIFGASLSKIEDSSTKALESKSPKVQVAINNLTEASSKDRGIKEKIKNLFSKSGEEKESNASKIDKKGKKDVLNSIKDAKDIKELKKIAGELKEKETEKNQEFLRSLIGHLEQFIDKGEFKKANDEAEKLRETLNNRFEVKDINEKEFKVLESFLNQFEIFRQDIANKKVDELFERKKSELKEKLDNAKDAEGFKSLIKLLKEVRKNIDDDQMALLMTLIDFKDNNALDRCSDIFENKGGTNNAENNNNIKKYIEEGEEEIKKLNKDGAFKIFMMQLFNIVNKLRGKLYDAPTPY